VAVVYGGEDPSSIIIKPENIKIIDKIKGKNNIRKFIDKFEEKFIPYDDLETDKN
jgi:hypothetical protein